MTYGLTTSCQLMENHIAADVLDAVDGFGSFQTPTGWIVILAIGDDGIYRASIQTPVNQTGWNVVDLSTQNALAALVQKSAGPSATYTVKSAAASMDGTTGTLTALVTVTAASAGVDTDMVFALSGPAGTDPSVWLADPAQTVWTPLPFAPADLPANLRSLTAADVSVTGVFIEMGIDQTEPALALAAVADPSQTGVNALFVLDTVVGTWTWLNVGVNFGQILSQDEGRTRLGNLSWGAFLLTTLNQGTSLVFQPAGGSYGGAAPPVVYAPPAGASALASFVYQPASMGGAAFTDLFVASPGTITCFPFDSKSGIAVIADPMIANVTQLHVVNAGTVAYLWGFAQDQNAETGTVFYASAPIAGIELAAGTAGGWSAPVALLTGVTMAAVLAGAPADQTAIMTLAPIAGGSATSGATIAPTLLAMNPTTGHWTTSVLPMPTTTDCLTLATYTTRVQVTDEGVPLAGQAVQVAVATACALIVNGQAANLAAGAATTVTTDMAGCLNFIYPVSSFAGASFTVTFPDATAVTVDAAQNTTATFAALSGQQISAATYTDPTGAIQHVVDPDNQTLQGYVAGVAKAANTLAGLAGTLPAAATTSLAARRAKSKAIHARLGDGSILMDLGDLVQTAVNYLEGIVETAVAQIEQDGKMVWQFTVKLADTVFSAILHCAEDALQAISAVFAWVEAEFEALFRWLAFLFDWQDILDIQKILLGAVNQIFTSAQVGVANLVSALQAYIGHVETAILPGYQPSTAFAAVSNADTAAGVFAAQSGPPPALGGANIQTDSRVGWLNDRANTPPAAGAGARRAKRLRDDPLASASAQIMSNLENLGTALLGDLSQVAAGQMSPQQFVTTVMTQLATMGFDDLNAVLAALDAEFESVVPLVQNYLNSPMDIPILSPLFADATKSTAFPDGEALTILTLLTLLQAIAFTIVYKIATDQDPATALTGLNLQGLVASGIGGLPAQLTAMTGTTRKNLKAARLAGDGDGGLGPATGTMLIVQAVTSFVVSTSEMTGSGQTLCNAYILDLFTRFLRGACEVSDPTADDFGGQYLIPIELTFHFFMLMWMGYIASTSEEEDDWDVEEVEAVTTVDELASLVWGAWELINTASGEVPCDAGHVFEIGVELTEYVTSLACKAARKNPNPDTVALAGTMAGLRALSAGGAGVLRFS